MTSLSKKKCHTAFSSSAWYLGALGFSCNLVMSLARRPTRGTFERTPFKSRTVTLCVPFRQFLYAFTSGFPRGADHILCKTPGEGELPTIIWPVDCTRALACLGFGCWLTNPQSLSPYPFAITQGPHASFEAMLGRLRL